MKVKFICRHLVEYNFHGHRNYVIYTKREKDFVKPTLFTNSSETIFWQLTSHITSMSIHLLLSGQHIFVVQCTRHSGQSENIVQLGQGQGIVVAVEVPLQNISSPLLFDRDTFVVRVVNRHLANGVIFDLLFII